MLAPDDGKPSSPVLRGLGASNGAWPLGTNSITSASPVSRAYRRECCQSVLFPPGSYCMVKPCRQASTVSTPRLPFLNTSGSWTSFVDDVKRCFRGSTETAEAGRGDYLANAFFA